MVKKTSAVVYKPPTLSKTGYQDPSSNYIPTIFSNGVNSVVTTNFLQELINKNIITLYADVGGAASTTLYTVPSGYILYIVSCCLSTFAAANLGGNNFGSLWLDNNIVLHASQSGEGDICYQSVATTFSLPIALKQGKIIELRSQVANAGSRGSVTGYLVPYSETVK